MPVGLNDTEQEKLQEFFMSEVERKRKASYFGRFAFWQSKEKTMDEAANGVLNDHSKAIFLMAPDNKFINFYRLDLAEKELAT